MVDLVVSFSYLGHDLSFRNIPDSTYGVIVKETARRWENDVTDSRAPTLLLEFLERSNSLAVEHDCWVREYLKNDFWKKIVNHRSEIFFTAPQT